MERVTGRCASKTYIGLLCLAVFGHVAAFFAFDAYGFGPVVSKTPRALVRAVPPDECVFDDECNNGECVLERTSEFPNGTYVCECDECWRDGDDGDPCSYELRPKLATFLISFFVGWTGADWFYLSRGDGCYICAGVCKLLTLGAFGVWALVDWIRVLADGFEDGNGKALCDW